MKLKFIADVHISPLTVKELQKAGYAITRVTDHLPSTASDRDIIQFASKEQSVIITQDLDFSAIIVQSGLDSPSVISLRVTDAKPDIITSILLNVLPSSDNLITEKIVANTNIVFLN